MLIYVHLQPAARRTALLGEHGQRLKIAVAAPPVEGRANEALVAWVASQLGVMRRQVNVAAGERSRDKTLRVAGISRAETLRRLTGQ